MATADNVLTVDFSKAPPAQGGGGTDYVKPGDYVLEVVSAEKGTANSGRKKITIDYVVAEGPSMGSRLRDIFVLPKDASDSLFGLQRLHAALIAYGFPLMNSKVQIPLDKLGGRKCRARVGDSELPASDKYEAKTVSKIQNYSPLGASSNGTAPVAAAKAQPAAPVVEDDDEPGAVPASIIDEDDPFGA